MGVVSVRRLVAYWIDTVFGWISAIVFAKMFLGSEPLFNALLLAVGYFMYFGLFESIFGAGIGKLITGLRVVKADGTKCGVIAALMRSVLRIIDTNPAFLGPVPAFASIFFSKKRQRIGDFVAGTVVIQRNR